MIWLTLCAIVAWPAWTGGAPGNEGLLVPGGTARLLRVAGVQAPVEPARALLIVVRALHRTRSISPEAGPSWEVRKHLEAAASAKSGGDYVPALLPPAMWEQAVFGEKVGAANLVARILADREAALLYHGLFSLDEETLAFFVDHPSLVSTIYRHDAGAFAAFADAVAVHDGRVSLPGGPSSAGRLEALVRAPAADPEAFITRLLQRDQGRLAWLFHTIERLDSVHQAFALGRGPEDLLSLHASFSAFDDGWSITDTPFSRYAFVDASMILQRIAVTPEGEMAMPAEREFWQAVFHNRRAFTGSQVGPSPPPSADRVTGAWLIDRFKDTPESLRRVHLDSVLFAQRLCAAAARASVSIDTSSLVETLSAFPEYPALIVTLERMGFTEPRDYALAVRAAAALTARFDAPQQSLRLAMFQGAIALIARMHEVGTLNTGAARDLCLNLFPLASSDGTRFPEAMVHWIETALLPALPSGTAAQADGAEARLTDALAGLSIKRPAPIIEWEGNRYRVDLAAAESVRLHRILRKLGGADLDDVLELGRINSRIMAPSSSAADVQAGASRLLELVPSLIGSGSSTLFGFPVSATRDALLTRVRQLSAGRADRKSADTRRSLTGALAIGLADMLASRVYAVAIGDPDASLLMAEDAARHHDFASGAAPPQGLWAVAAVRRTEAGSAAGGSLLALERALARYWLRPTTLAAPATRPLLWEQVLGFAETVAAFNPGELSDENRDALVAALRRGRDRLAAVAARPDDVDRLAAGAGVEGWRRRLIRLAATADPGAVAGYFSLGEVLRIGLDGSAAPDLDAWGPSLRSIDGSLDRRLPVRLDWDEMASRPTTELLSTRIADPQLRVAEWLAELKLPAVLAPGIMAYAMWDLVMNAQMADRDDWLSVLRAAQQLPADRMANYVSALTADGPLVPVAK